MSIFSKKKEPKKSFAVIGLGTFGYETATALYEDGADVIALDLNEDKVNRIGSRVSRAVVGDAINEEVLRSIGVLDVDSVVIAVKNHFDTTVLVTHILREAGVKNIYVQVDTEREASAIKALGASDVIFPERDLARRLARQLLYPNLADLLPLGDDFGVLEVEVPTSFEGKSLIDVEIRKRHKLTVIAIKHLPEAERLSPRYEVNPAPDAPLQKGDILVVIGQTKRLSKFREFAEGTGE